MQLVQYDDGHGTAGVGLVEGDEVVPLDLARGEYATLSAILEVDDPAQVVARLADRARPALALAATRLLPPIDRQEVWAAGVTYRRSRTARMEESPAGATFYDKVYDAPRPELFLKATPERVVGPGEPVRIRRDSAWSVPEPELALVLSSRLKLVAYTIGNDMSARDIEGENPLYLPQAKVYDRCCAMGPAVTLAAAMPEPEAIGIRLVIRRGGKVAFEGQTTASQMRRSFDELIDWLGRETTFPHGAVLLTGTGIVPPDDFSLSAGDRCEISIDGIGTLANPVERL